MIPREKLVEIGNFTKPHGIKGEIAVHFDSDVIPLVEGFGHLFVEIDGLMIPFSVIAIRPKSAETLLLTLKGIDNQEKAAQLSNLPVFIECELVPDYDDEYGGDEDGFYLEDLIGFTLISDGDSVGIISDYDDSTDNLLFSVDTPSGNTILVPASGDLIDEVDTSARTVSMDLPEGLLSL